MACETELIVEPWNPGMSGDRGLLNDLLPFSAESDRKKFSWRDPLEDETAISLKVWQLGLRDYSVEQGSTVVAPFRLFKGSVRTRFTPIEPRLDEDVRTSPERSETTLTTPRASSSGTRSGSVLPTRLENSSPRDSSLETFGFHHLQNANVARGKVSPQRIPGNVLGEINLHDSNSGNFRARSSRGISLRVSSLDDSGILQNPSSCTRSSLTSRTPLSSKDRPEWESCTEIYPESAPTPARRVKPNPHGAGRRTRITSGGTPQGSPLPEAESQHQSHGVTLSGDRVSQLRHPFVQVRSKSLDLTGERSTYDSSPNFVPGSPASTPGFGRGDTPISNPDLPLPSPSFLLRCNARRHDIDDDGREANDEDVKVGTLCSGDLSDNNVPVDCLRLVSKLCRLPVPLSKQTISRPPHQRGHAVDRSSSMPAQFLSYETLNSSMPCQDTVIIGRYNTLKLLCERCSKGPTPTYSVSKPRKSRDHEPHQHIYKMISKSLDQKLRS